MLLLATLFLLAPVSMLLAQNKVEVWGQVTDANGPMIGASVIEQGTSNGTTTDADGRYRMQVNQGATLLFTFLGYQNQEVAATPGQHDVTLREEDNRLDDVVVVGYGVQKKSSVTGAISQVKPEDMQNRTITNAQSALQGKTAGVQIIQTSAAPGSAATIPERRLQPALRRGRRASVGHQRYRPQRHSLYGGAQRCRFGRYLRCRGR